MKVGVLFGTYNPIHNGHLLISTVLLNGGYFDKVIYSVANKKEKAGEIVPSMEERATMIYRAFKETNDYVYNDVEISDNIGVSFIEKRGESWRVYDCFEQLKKENPENEYCLVIGADQMNVFHTWYRFQDLINEYNVHCMFRGDQIHRNELKYSNAKNGIDIRKVTYVEDFPTIGISSTAIRNLVKEDKNIDFYVPKGVKKYIQINKLYK